MRTRVGYAGGAKPNPTYRSLGDHTEAVQVDYDPARVSYEELLEIFWAEHDPRHRPYSRQYMSAVFAANEAEHARAEQSRAQRAARLGVAELHTEITAGARFYRAEDYHQKYYLRAHRDLMRAFAGYPERSFTDSTVAARLNGFVGGERNADLLAAEIDAYGLSPAVAGKLRDLVGTVSRSQPGGL